MNVENHNMTYENVNVSKESKTPRNESGNFIPKTPSSVASFRMKGCRWGLLYEGHLPKENFFTWFQKAIITRKCDGKLKTFIGHIMIGTTKMTRVIFKTDCIIDWKDPNKFDFPVPDYGAISEDTPEIRVKKIKPEIKCIYKTQWAPEYQLLVKADPDTYPKLDPTSSAKSPRPMGYRPAELSAPIPVPVPIPEIQELSAPIPVPEPGVFESPEIITPVPTPELKALIPEIQELRMLVPELTSLKSQVSTLESHIIYLANKYADLVKFNNILARKINTDIDTGVYINLISELNDMDNKSIIQYGVTKSKAMLGFNPSIFVNISEILLDDALKIIRDCLSNLPPSIISVVHHKDDTYVIKNSDIFILEKIVRLLF